MVKVYVFSLKDSKGMYAFTINKEYALMFKEQRNMSLFKEQKISLDKYEFMVFSNRMSKYQIILDVLYDGENDIDIASTIYESDKLSEACEKIRRISENINESVCKYNLSKKYLKVILRLTQIIMK